MPAFFDVTEPHMMMTGAALLGIIVVFSALDCVLRWKYKDYGRTRPSHRKGATPASSPGADFLSDPDSEYLRVGVIGRPRDAFDKARVVRVVKEVFGQIGRSAERAGSAGRVTVVSGLSKCGPFSYAFAEAKIRGWRTVGVYETDFQRANPCFRCSKYASVASSYGFFHTLFKGKTARTLPDAVARRADILIFVTTAGGGGSKGQEQEVEEEARCAAAYDSFRGMKILYSLDGDDYLTPKKANNFDDALFGSGAKSEGNFVNSGVSQKEGDAKARKRARRHKREEQIQRERANGHEIDDIEDEMD